MNDGPQRTAYGIIFVGPPGLFSTWTATPHGEVMDREAVEKLGQLAALAGAADYRVFALESDEADHRFATEASIQSYRPMLEATSGIPPPSSDGVTGGGEREPSD